MSLPISKSIKKTGFFYSTALTELIHQLEGLADEMVSDGFDPEAATLRTTISDLQWQYEEVINRELAGQWPNGPRRPIVTPVRLIG